MTCKNLHCLDMFNEILIATIFWLMIQRPIFYGNSDEHDMKKSSEIKPLNGSNRKPDHWSYHSAIADCANYLFISIRICLLRQKVKLKLISLNN